MSVSRLRAEPTLPLRDHASSLPHSVRFTCTTTISTTPRPRLCETCSRRALMVRPYLSTSAARLLLFKDILYRASFDGCDLQKTFHESHSCS
eukprot:6184479-Pleurochrysis_carterae.AAC.1